MVKIPRGTVGSRAIRPHIAVNVCIYRKAIRVQGHTRADGGWRVGWGFFHADDLDNVDFIMTLEGKRLPYHAVWEYRVDKSAPHMSIHPHHWETALAMDRKGRARAAD